MLKPILFNTDMVRAILDGRKTVTRRLVKPHYRPGEVAWQVISELHSGKYVRIEYLDEWEDVTRYMNEPYRPGDILYVRETWKVQSAHRYEADARIMFKAGGDLMTKIQFAGRCSDSHERHDYDSFINKWGVDGKWHPSIHMPKEAARIFLRVTDVRVERLQEIDEVQAQREGCYAGPIIAGSDLWADARPAFPAVWDRTLKSNIDLDTYGWEANPWVWVIEFERCEKPEED